MTENLTQKTETNQPDFTEKVISEVRKTRTISRFMCFREYQCNNCGSYKIGEHYTSETFERHPNPNVFGSNAKPVIRTREKDHLYFCRSCGIENANLRKLADYLGASQIV